ncbi:MAG: bifunctional folylpolyglutamate synthase/dihydrofolate synthase, partial [Dehalococcoidia bacterium]|nr:bifunctional folylpolyglutamate synthase/dihydrofolate synthase [Dehalococcoidia bacterium]
MRLYSHILVALRVTGVVRLGLRLKRRVIVSIDYQDALDYIFSFTDYEKRSGFSYSVDFDLRRVEALLRRLGDPHKGAMTIHVAGSKGKGSTATMIASVLGADGYRVGLYTSPHLHTLRERIRVGDDLISKEDVSVLVEKISHEVNAVNNPGVYGQLTVFEILTVLAFMYFKRQQVGIQVLEVGLGGRLDATNVIVPDVCVITTISLDHTDVLGKTVADIAKEKAGIIKHDAMVVSGPQSSEAMAVIEQTCREKRAKLIKVGTDISWKGKSFNLDGQSLEVKGKRGHYRFAMPLLGDHQMENASVAVAVIETLCDMGIDVASESIPSGMARICLPGRFQVFGSHPSLVIDG